MNKKQRGFEKIITKQNEVSTILPLRGTKTSAGYDFFTPVDLAIKPQDKVFFWTDVKSYMQDGEVLLLDVRSSSGTKLDLMLANTIGVVDSDYYDNAGNEGNIGICLRNLKPEIKFRGYQEITIGEMQFSIPIIADLQEENTVFIKAGDRVAQGIFINYLPSDNCNTEAERGGGYGSTNTK